MFSSPKSKRFQSSYSEGAKDSSIHRIEVIVDSQTGVNYLLVSSITSHGSGCALTPLLDSSGSPIITKSI